MSFCYFKFVFWFIVSHVLMQYRIRGTTWHKNLHIMSSRMWITSEKSTNKHIWFYSLVHYLQTKVLAKVFIRLILKYGTSELVASFVFNQCTYMCTHLPTLTVAWLWSDWETQLTWANQHWVMKAITHHSHFPTSCQT